ncbi:MAG: hypothetical protein M3Z65_08875 [Chloroflexota bacterium]|nr:hypothetical protein [Chloroflexota bacterium]
MVTATKPEPPALRHWSAWLPLAIPLFLLLLGLRHVVLYGPVGEADEGTEAHLFQLLMPVQLFAIVYFAFTWLPRARRDAMVMLVLHVAATFALLAAVYWADHLPLAR